MQCKIAHVQKFRDFCNGAHLAKIIVADVYRRVSHLLFLRRPAAVLFAIVALVIFPVERVGACRGKAHVSQEILEQLPSFTDRNSTATVPPKFACVGAATAIQHPGPSEERIFRDWITSVSRCAMFSGSTNQPLDFQTATALASAGNNVVGVLLFDVAAHALAQPGSVSANFSEPDDCESAELFPYRRISKV